MFRNGVAPRHVLRYESRTIAPDLGECADAKCDFALITVAAAKQMPPVKELSIGVADGPISTPARNDAVTFDLIAEEAVLEPDAEESWILKRPQRTVDPYSSAIWSRTIRLGVMMSVREARSK
jgi:hypothetical protein